MSPFISPCVHYGHVIFAHRIKHHLLLENTDYAETHRIPFLDNCPNRNIPQTARRIVQCSFCHRLIRNPQPMVFDLICLSIPSNKKDFLMNTKEWGVLSFLVGISMAGLYQEVPSTMFVLVVVPVFCTIIGYSAWRSSTSLSHTIHARPQLEKKQTAVRSFQRSF